MMTNLYKEQLMTTALTQRIGEITSQYESRLAEVRADATIRIAQLEEENRRLNELLGLKEKDNEPDTNDTN